MLDDVRNRISAGSGAFHARRMPDPAPERAHLAAAYAS
jgi:hypothetical protein